jgi:excinuclease ABC subunit A
MIVAAGPPEQVATVVASHTGRFLSDILGQRVKPKSAPKPKTTKRPADARKRA